MDPEILTRLDAPPSLSRRQLLRMAAVAGVGGAVLAACGGSSDDGVSGASSSSAAPAGSSTTSPVACVLTPEATEGPYYVNDPQIRRDITDGRPGLPVTLAITVLDAGACTPVVGAAVDIWHCDAEGTYSGVQGLSDDADDLFLRGVQLTNADGVATFRTIYPGWYPGRAVHVHVKVHTGGTSSGDALSGGTTVHTGQIFFDESLTDDVYELEPYSGQTGRRTTNDEDSIFEGAGGADAIASFTRTGSDLADGLRGAITLGVDPTATTSGSGSGPGSR